jgi:hypothetical protein
MKRHTVDTAATANTSPRSPHASAWLNFELLSLIAGSAPIEVPPPARPASAKSAGSRQKLALGGEAALSMSLCNAKGVSESGAGGISGGISDVSLKRSHAATSVGLSLSSSATSEEVALSTLRRGVSVSSRQACSASFRFTADEPHAAASAKPDEKGRGGGSRSERVTQSASVSGVVPHSVGEMRKRAGERARERARDWERDRANLAMSPTSFGGLASDYSSLYFLRTAGGTGPPGAGGGPGGGGRSWGRWAASQDTYVVE